MERVCDYMIAQLITVKSSDLLVDAIRLMKKKKIGSVLVKEGSQTVGILTERDLITRIQWNDVKKIEKLRVCEVMSKDLKKVSYDESYTDVIALMRKYNIRHLPVEKENRVIGIVSLRDLARSHEEVLKHRLQEQEKLLLNQFKAIRESEERFRTVFDHSAMGIMVTDSKENIIMCNPFALQLLGMERDDLIGKPVQELYPAEEWNRIRAHNIRKLGMKHHLETKVFNKQKKLIEVNIAISVLKDSDGKVIGSIGFLRDITERKKLERIRQEFVGVVSHELRTPLVPIREGISQVLDGMFGEINKEQREYLEIVFNEINRLKRIVDDLLDVFRFEIEKVPMKKELVDLNKIVKGAVATFLPKAKSKNLAIVTKLPPKPVMLYADPDRITQVLANLISNSFKFTQKGGITISVKRKKDVAECKIEDTGEGMTKANLASIFQKFQQFRKVKRLDEKGTGLGLVICKEIIELHKGKISVTSTFRKGSAFTFTLPYSSSQALLKELMADTLKAAIEHDSSFSTVIFQVHAQEADDAQVNQKKLYEVTELVALMIRNSLRRSKDFCLQEGKDIFTILPDTPKEGAHTLAQRINDKFNEHFSRGDFSVPITLSWKIANFPVDGETVLELFAKAA